MSDTVVVTATFHVAPGKREQLLDLIHSLMPRVHDEPGCILCATHESDDGTILMIEKWQSDELWRTHLAKGAFSDSGPMLDPLLTEPVQIVRWNSIRIGDPTKGAV